MDVLKRILKLPFLVIGGLLFVVLGCAYNLFGKDEVFFNLIKRAVESADKSRKQE